jgi:hypothetical protein
MSREATKRAMNHIEIIAMSRGSSGVASAYRIVHASLVDHAIAGVSQLRDGRNPSRRRRPKHRPVTFDQGNPREAQF